jgi:hypothetical protein
MKSDKKRAHTPGPWEVGDGMTRHIAIMARDFTYDVCEVTRAGITEDEQVGNARLIAASPELLSACQALMKAEGMQQGERGGYTMGAISLAIDAARAAIAKAKGEK